MKSPVLQAAPRKAQVKIDRRSDLPYRDFVHEYLYRHRPVLIHGAVPDWPALTRWTPEYFKQRFGDRVLKLEKEYRVAELADLIERSDTDSPAPYLHAQHLKYTFPELLDDIAPLPAYLFPQWLDDYYVPANVRERLNDHSSAEIFFGGKAAGFPFLHYDDLHYHAFSVQIYGQKRFYLYPTSQTPNVYPFPDKPNFSQARDVEKPDLDRFPRFADARPMTFVIEPGDLLFVPCGWWHATKMLSPSISISISHMNGSNWATFRQGLCDEMRPFHPRLIGVYGGLLRIQGWWKKCRDRFFSVVVNPEGSVLKGISEHEFGLHIAGRTLLSISRRSLTMTVIRGKILGALLCMLLASAAAIVIATQARADHEGQHHGEHFVKCAKVCADCQIQCDSCFKHCLKLLAHGKKERDKTAQLCADCGECCKTCSTLCARHSPLARPILECCAKCCDECAAACEKVKDDKHMAACAKSCRDCAKSCRDMNQHLTA